jgi:hypothetical protein
VSEKERLRESGAERGAMSRTPSSKLGQRLQPKPLRTPTVHEEDIKVFLLFLSFFSVQHLIFGFGVFAVNTGSRERFGGLNLEPSAISVSQSLQRMHHLSPSLM